MEAQPQPAEIDLRGPGMRKIMKESAYQLVKELRTFIEESEFRHQVYTTFTDRNFEQPHSMAAIQDSVRAGFNISYDSWYQTLVIYFSQYADNIHTNAAQFGSLHGEQGSMSHEDAVKIVKARISWLLINADELQA